MNFEAWLFEREKKKSTAGNKSLDTSVVLVHMRVVRVRAWGATLKNKAQRLIRTGTNQSHQKHVMFRRAAIRPTLGLPESLVGWLVDSRTQTDM